MKRSILLAAVAALSLLAVACASLTASQQATIANVQQAVAKVCVPLEAVNAIVAQTTLIPATDQDAASKFAKAVNDVCTGATVTITTLQNVVDVVLPLGGQLVTDIDNNKTAAAAIVVDINDVKKVLDVWLQAQVGAASTATPASAASAPAAASSST